MGHPTDIDHATLDFRVVSLSPILGIELTLKKNYWSAWMAQSVKRPTLDFSSGHDLMVHEFKPHIMLFTDSLKPAWDSFPLPLSAHPQLMCA